MQRFRKAIAILILILFVVHFVISIALPKDNQSKLIKEKTFGDYIVTFIVGTSPHTKQPLVGNKVFFGYDFEDLNGGEVRDIYYLPGKEFEIRKDDKVINGDDDFKKYFENKKRTPDKVAVYTFNALGVYKITSQFEHNGKIIATEFFVEVKTKEKYEEERVKGTLVIVFSFILVVIFAIYLYEKLEKPEKKKAKK